MVTDPPYGVDYDAGWRNRVHRKDGTLWQNFTGQPAVLEKTGVPFPVNADAFALPVKIAAQA
jgi:hypothetical protein